MNTYLKSIISFTLQHKIFTLFSLVCLVLNILFLLNLTPQSTTFITCSSYDNGPLGTYAFFEDLKQSGVCAQRLQLSPYQELHAQKNTGKTLIILSPVIIPGDWEWKIIMEWVAKGNRLITAGFYGPRSFWKFNRTVDLAETKIHQGPVRVILPVDSVFPYPEVLSTPLFNINPLLSAQENRDQDSSLIRYFSELPANTMPFMVCQNKPISVKKAIGKGEWILFTQCNPFGNTLLKDSAWYRFATRLVGGNPVYADNEIYFDEYHNGYRATKSFWQLLCYYQFNDGIVYLSVLVLLFLFFTGIRMLTPVASFVQPEKDVIPGLRAVSMLFLKYKAWNGLLCREMVLIRKELTGSRRSQPLSADALAGEYCKKAQLPDSLRNKEALAHFIQTIEEASDSLDKKEIIKTCNTIIFMRKELNL